LINRIIEYSLKNPTIIILAFLILLGVSYSFYLQLPVDVYPNLNFPVVTVVTENSGMPPQDIETLISFPIETSCNSIPHITRVRSVSALGISLVTVEFEQGIDIYFARQLVSEKLQLINPMLPEGTESPFIAPISSMFADAIEFTLKGDDLFEVRDFAEWHLKPRLQTLSGVSNVINFGGFLKQYHVLLEPSRMLGYNISVNQVIEALQSNNINSSGGILVRGPEEQIIRGMGRIATIEDIENIVLAHNQDLPIYINDVADVRIGAYVRRGSAGESGREVVAVTVQNQYNSNVLRTIANVEEVLGQVVTEVGDRVKIDTFYTQLDMIMKSIANLSLSMAMGAFLVIFVLYIFLNNIRSTLVVAFSIPLSVVISIISFRFFDLSLNIMTLGGLAIGIGLIVDSAIIMTENIYRHLQEERSESFRSAVLEGAKEVGRPIFFSILIFLAVFFPIFTLQGIEGRMFVPLSLAVSSAVFGSLIVSLTLTPVLASLVFRKRLPAKTAILIRFTRKIYNPLLNHALAHSGRMAVTCLIVVALGIFMFSRLGTEFMPEMDESSLLMDILLPPQTSLDESGRIASLICERVSVLPEVQRVVRRTGRARGAEHAEPVNLTESNVVLAQKEDRTKSIEEIKTDIRKAVAGVPGVSIILNAPLQHRINHATTGTKTAIAVKIFGENLSTATDAADRLYDLMNTIPGVIDLQLEQITGVPQLQIRMDRRKIARYGLNVNDVSNVIKVAFKGHVATELIETQKRYEVFARYKEEYRSDENKIRNTLIVTPAGYKIPLSELTEIVEYDNPAIVRRENALRRVMVQCNVTGRDMGSVVDEIRRSIAGLDLPEGYFISIGGTYESQIRALRQLTIVIAMTIIIVFSLLVVNFRSAKNAFLIIINIPLALAGGIMILTITGNTLSVPSLVGFIALIGVAVQDGIVLVSHINGFREKGIELREAIVRGANNKLRPVLVTTFTTLLGLLPLAIRNVTGSEIQRPMAIVIMFGLVLSTLITLVVLPTLYAALEKNGVRH